MAIIKACSVESVIKNTGADSNVNLAAAAALFLVPESFYATDSDLATLQAFLQAKIHAARGERIFMLFGNSVPIRGIENNKESDVIVTLGDGSKHFVRYGFLNMRYMTTDGGLCYAKALQSLNGAKMRAIIVDKENKMMMRRSDIAGRHEGLILSQIYAPSVDIADFDNPAKSYLEISLDPQEYVGRGEILTSTTSEISDILGLEGLSDGYLEAGAAASTTKIKIKVYSSCCDDDLVAQLGALFTDDPTNFKVVRNSTGLEVTITSSAENGAGEVELNGTFVSTAAYTVYVRTPAELLANDIVGFEFAEGIVVTIP